MGGKCAQHCVAIGPPKRLYFMPTSEADLHKVECTCKRRNQRFPQRYRSDTICSENSPRPGIEPCLLSFRLPFLVLSVHRFVPSSSLEKYKNMVSDRAPIPLFLLAAKLATPWENANFDISSFVGSSGFGWWGWGGNNVQYHLHTSIILRLLTPQLSLCHLLILGGFGWGQWGGNNVQQHLHTQMMLCYGTSMSLVTVHVRLLTSCKVNLQEMTYHCSCSLCQVTLCYGGVSFAILLYRQFSLNKICSGVFQLGSLQQRRVCKDLCETSCGCRMLAFSRVFSQSKCGEMRLVI